MRWWLDGKYVTACWFSNCSHWGITRFPGYLALDAGPLCIELNW